MSNQEEIIEVAGKKVVVRYARTQEEACVSCAFCSRKECHDLDCNMRDIIGEGVCKYAYFIEAEQPQEPDYKKLYEDIVNSEWYKKYYHGKSVGDSVEIERPEADLDAEIDKEVKKLHTAPCYNELEAFARHFVAVGATMDAKKKRVTMSGFYSPISPNRLVNIPDLANKGALFQDAGFVPGEPVEITIEAHEREK